MVKWIEEQTEMCTSRTVPLIMGHFSDGFGRVKVQGARAFQARSDEHVGAHGQEREHYVSGLLREYMRHQNMAVVDTFYDTGPTYYGDKWTSRVDHIIGPTTFTQLCTRCWTDRRATRKLQPTHTATPTDHCPLHIDFKYSLKQRYNGEQTPQGIKVDRDQLMAALSRGHKRMAFFDELERCTKSKDDQAWEELKQDGSADGMWAALVEAIQQATATIFKQGQLRDPEYEQAKERRMQIMRERSEFYSTA